MTSKLKTKRYDVPTVEHNRRKTDQPGFDTPATKNDIELLKAKIEEVLKKLSDEEIIVPTPKI
jgi:hypothetical protein